MTQPAARPAAYAGGPLAGIRVLDLSTMLAGPYGATLLGDLGADVIKVESHYGDDSRHLGPETRRRAGAVPRAQPQQAQRSCSISRSRPRRRSSRGSRRRPTSSITNVREPALSRLGIDYESVRRHRPDVIWVGVTAFGPDGPYAGRPGIDFLAQGYAGLIAVNGDPSAPAGARHRAAGRRDDLDAASRPACSPRCASATRRGRASASTSRCLDVLTHAQATVLQSYLLAGEVVPRTGNRSHFFAPSGVYECGDGQSLVPHLPVGEVLPEPVPGARRRLGRRSALRAHRRPAREPGRARRA